MGLFCFILSKTLFRWRPLKMRFIFLGITTDPCTCNSFPSCFYSHFYWMYCFAFHYLYNEIIKMNIGTWQVWSRKKLHCRRIPNIIAWIAAEPFSAEKTSFFMPFIQTSVLALWGQKEERKSESWSLQETKLLTRQRVPVRVLQGTRLLGWILLLTATWRGGNVPADVSNPQLPPQRSLTPARAPGLGSAAPRTHLNPDNNYISPKNTHRVTLSHPLVAISVVFFCPNLPYPDKIPPSMRWVWEGFVGVSPHFVPLCPQPRSDKSLSTPQTFHPKRAGCQGWVMQILMERIRGPQGCSTDAGYYLTLGNTAIGSRCKEEVWGEGFWGTSFPH